MADKVVNLNPAGLVSLLRETPTEMLKKFCSIRVITLPDLIKKDRITGQTFEEKFGFSPDRLRKVVDQDMTKEGRVMAGLGYDYVNVVFTRLNKEGKPEEVYVPGNTWHCPAFPGCSIIRKNKKDINGTGQLYVAVFYITNNPPHMKYVDMETGAEIDKDRLESILTKTYPPKNQGLNNPVIYRTYKVEDFEEIQAGGTLYRISHV